MTDHGVERQSGGSQMIEEKVMTTVQLIPNPQIATHGPTVFKTELNQHEVRCGMCGRTIYTDEETFSFVSDAIKAGLDDPFRCELCKEEYDDLFYEG
jgi:hypothetical protein